MIAGRGVGMLATFALAVSIVAGCSHPTRLRVYNETGAPIVLQISRHIKPGVERPDRVEIANGEHGEVFALEFRSISARGCVYDYSTSLPVKTNSMHVAVQIEPDFRAHLLSLKAGRDQIGAFRDGAAPGFPARPSSRCGAVRAP